MLLDMAGCLHVDRWVLALTRAETRLAELEFEPGTSRAPICNCADPVGDNCTQLHLRYPSLAKLEPA